MRPVTTGGVRRTSDHHHSHSHDGELEDHDRGLAFDLQNTRHRRAFLGMVGAGAVAGIPTETPAPTRATGPMAPTHSPSRASSAATSGAASAAPRRRPRASPSSSKLRLVDTEDLSPLVTSQLALPRTTSMKVYNRVAGYEESVTSLNRVSISSDMVFADDGGVRELARIKGNLRTGYLAKLVVPVDV